MEKTASLLFWKEMPKFDLKVSREGFCQRGRASSFQAEGLKTEKVKEPEDSGEWKLVFVCADVSRTLWTRVKVTGVLRPVNPCSYIKVTVGTKSRTHNIQRINSNSSSMTQELVESKLNQ